MLCKIQVIVPQIRFTVFCFGELILGLRNSELVAHAAVRTSMRITELHFNMSVVWFIQSMNWVGFWSAFNMSFQFSESCG